MLVDFIQSAVFEMKIDVQEGFFKKRTVTHTEYIKLWIARGICDESEVDAKIQKGFAEIVTEYEKFGYYDIKICTDVDVLAKKYPYEVRQEIERFAEHKPKITYLKDMKMSKILELLTGEQFVQFCKETKQSVEEAVKGETLG